MKKKEIGAGRLLLGVTMIVALVWIGWTIVSGTAARNLALQAPERALRFNGSEPLALDRLAQQEVIDPDGDLAAAKDWAQRALRSRPLDDQALFAMGLAAQRKHDDKSAETLMRMAGARTWRDIGTQTWLYDHAIRHGDFVKALQHGDAILRSDPAFEQRLYPALAAYTRTPPTLQALADFLATDPPWRARFLRWLSGHLAAESDLALLFAKLKSGTKPPTTEELVPYVNRLVRSGRFAGAYRAWQGTLPPAERANAHYPYNRDFTRPLEGLPFNWQIFSVPGADIQIVAPEGGKKLALRVQFSGARVEFANVKQLMMLPPGRYRLSGRVKADDLETPRGLRWHVFCATEAGASLAQTQLVAGTIPWSDFATDFEVPAEACPAQWLRLELPARIASEHRIEGQVWYQFLRIVPLGAGGAAGG